ncbi:hypothetical protein PTKIN_Ptkin02bG0122600 [Pterospermum kingtungense]
MAQIASSVKVLESVHVSVPTTFVPLVHFDMPWFYSRPIQRLFFYEFPHPTLHFMEVTLPMLKRSLSPTLQHFFPYAANIMCPQPPGKPYIHYMECDFVNFTVAESTADFNNIVANYPRPIKLFHPFVAQLSPARLTEDGIRVLPIIAFQITVFPNTGICIGSTYCHVVGDGKSFMHFMRSRTSIYRSGGDLTCIENSLPLMNKDVIKNPQGIELLLLKQFWHWISSCSENSAVNRDVVPDKVRASFVLERAHAERLKQLVTAHCRNNVDSEQIHISTFAVTCAFIWLPYTVLAPEPLGISGTINILRELFKTRDAEHCLSSIRERGISGSLTPVAGSPKFHVYDTDFGWGTPCKVELTHIDNDGATSMADCKDGLGGIEVGLALNKDEMDEFVTIFEQSLKLL